MKRALPIVGILLVLLLAAGPASAAISCAMSNSAMGPSCPMGIAGMDADCPMSHALAAADCSQDCCNRAAPIALVQNGIPVKPKLLATSLQLATIAIPIEAERNSRPEAPAFFAANSPPRYILLRVFRI